MSRIFLRCSLVALFAILTLPLFFQVRPVRADKSALTLIYREDFNGDGRVTIADVIAMLILGRDNPEGGNLDYNGDGRYDITDAVSLIINISRKDLHLYDSAEGWRGVGQGGGGAMFIPTVDPFDQKHAFIACDMTGAYVTVDNGASWRMFNLRDGIRDFEFDPSTPGTVYASTTGLYRSEDGGVRWSLINPNPADVVAEHMVGDHAEHWFQSVNDNDLLPQYGYSMLRVDPQDPNHLYLAVQPRWAVASHLLVSHDRGATWRNFKPEFNQEDQIIAIFPGSWWGNSAEVIAVTSNGAAWANEETGYINWLVLPDKPLLAADGGSGAEGPIFYVLSSMTANSGVVMGGLFRSKDLGATWETLKKSLYTSVSDIPSFNTLAVCEKHPEVIYLSCSSSSNGSQFGTWKSTDKGETWKWVYKADGARVLSNNMTASWMNATYGPSWAGNPISLGICPTNPDVCYATDYGTAYRTLDGGNTWEEVYSNNHADRSYSSRGLDVTGGYGVFFDPFDSLNVIIPYTDVGMFGSYNGGESWVHTLQGIPSGWQNTCYWLVFDPEVKDRVWSVWTDCHDLPRDKMFRSGKLASGGYSGGVAVSENGGKSWMPNYSGIPGNTVCTHIVLDPTSPAALRTLYVCGFSKGVYKTTDSGKSWTEVSNGIGYNHNAWRIVLIPGGKLFLLVARGWEQGKGIIDGALYSSDDGAANWKEVSLPTGVNAPNDLVYDPSNPQRMYLSCWPTEDRTVEPWVERRGGLLRTEDGGVTWKRVFREDAHVYASALDPSNLSTIIINTFDSAAFRSDDRGETWRRLRGYNFKWGYRPVFDPHHPGMIYLTTFGGRIFYGPANGVPGAFEDVDNVPDEWRWQNYTGEEK